MAANEDVTIVSQTGAGAYQMQARVGDVAFLIDEPVMSGGLGSGPNPYNLLSAALGACTAMTIRLYADRKGWPLQNVRVSVRHGRADLKARDAFQADILLEGSLDAAQRTRLMEIAQRCPVHLTLERGADVHASLLPPDAPAGSASVADQGHMTCMLEACAD